MSSALPARHLIDFDADDSGSVQHEIIPPSDDEIEAEIDAFFALFTEPKRARRGA